MPAGVRCDHAGAGRRRGHPEGHREHRWASSGRWTIKIPMVIDRAVAAMPTVVVGGNEVDVHLKGVVPGRDFPLDRVLDLRNADAGDPCPRCGAAMVVQAGDRDRPRLQARHQVLQGDGGEPTSTRRGPRSPIIMGCYGIGINRIIAAAVEAGHDDNGIIWPLAIAPYQVVARAAPGAQAPR